MKKIFALISAFLMVFPIIFIASCESNNTAGTELITSSVMEIKSFDGYMLKGELSLPGGNKKIPKLVIYINGSGPNVYSSNSFWANELPTNNVAFFSYNTRGVSAGTDGSAPSINEEEYKTYLPSNSVEDIYYIIKTLKENKRLKNSKILLYGYNEGTIIAPLVALKYPDSVDALLLSGYINDNLKDVIVWQNTGGPSMVWYKNKFAADDKGRITKEAYEADPNGVIKTVLADSTFETIDLNGNGYIEEDDFAMRWKYIAGYDIADLLDAIERKDDTWLKDHYGIRLTSDWFTEYFNMRSNSEVLPLLNLPIYIFHGTLDQNFPIDGVYAIRDKFAELNKNNLTVNIFDNLDYGLNMVNDDMTKIDGISPGVQAILDTIINIK